MYSKYTCIICMICNVYITNSVHSNVYIVYYMNKHIWILCFRWFLTPFNQHRYIILRSLFKIFDSRQIPRKSMRRSMVISLQQRTPRLIENKCVRRSFVYDAVPNVLCDGCQFIITEITFYCITRWGSQNGWACSGWVTEREREGNEEMNVVRGNPVTAKIMAVQQNKEKQEIAHHK